MKLGKEVFLAMIETALFVAGAIFFLIVLIIPANPLWALIAGIACGLTGAIVWSCSFFVRISKRIGTRVGELGNKIHNKIEKNKVNPENVARKILEDDDIDHYELHRADSYDNYTDEILPGVLEPEKTSEQPLPTNTPTPTSNQPKTKSKK